MEYLGNKELLNVHKTAFLASSTIPPDMVLKCYDWATATRQSKTTAHVRNKYICEIADQIVFVGVNETSSLYNLREEYQVKDTSKDHGIVLKPQRD